MVHTAGSSPHTLAARRSSLAPETERAFLEFSKQVFAEGALSLRTKEIVAVAVAHVTQCPYCIRGHTRSAERAGATPQELMEAIWVAAEMRAGAAFGHSALALAEMKWRRRAAKLLPHRHRHGRRQDAGGGGPSPAAARIGRQRRRHEADRGRSDRW